MPWRIVRVGVAMLLCVILLAPATAALAQQAPPSVQQSRNWAGYVATNAYYTGVTALIQTPAATGQQLVGSVASWVGIGGAQSTDLIQAGVAVQQTGFNITYSAWVEMLPAASQQISVTVGPGQWVLVDIHELAFDLWQITVVNGTQVYQRQFNYTSSHSSAEWIVEEPSVGRGRQTPLEAVTGANMMNMAAIANGQSVIPSQLWPTPTEIVGVGGRVKASPSPLGSGGNSFSVTTTARPFF